MTLHSRRLGRLFCCLLILAVIVPPGFAADPAKTIVNDTIYRADGTPASGTLLISWPAFITAEGKPVAAGSMNVRIGPNGGINLPLVPTQGATPAGSYYKVVLKLDDGATSTEYWSVPTLSPTTIAAIRSSVVPASVALQVVSREYVDAADAGSVHKNGAETIAGVKTFSASPLVPAPAVDDAAASKGYVDAQVAAGGANVLALNKGGTGQNAWTSARCVRVASDGSQLESAATDCGVANVDWAHPGSLGSATPNAASFTTVTLRGQDLERHAAGFAGADAGARIAAAIADCASSGCLVHADVSGAIATDIFSGVTKPVTLVFGAGTFTFPPADLTIPPNIALHFQQGAQWDVPSGKTVTIRGAVTAPATAHIFAGSGSVTLTGQDPIYAGWYGVKGCDASGCNNVDNDTAAANRMMAQSPGRHWVFPPTQTYWTNYNFGNISYRFSGSLQMHGGTTPAYMGPAWFDCPVPGTQLQFTNNGFGGSPMLLTDSNPYTAGQKITGCSFIGNSYYPADVSGYKRFGSGASDLDGVSSPDCIVVQAGKVSIENVQLTFCGRHGILITGSADSWRINDSWIWGAGAYGIYTIGGDAAAGLATNVRTQANWYGGFFDASYTAVNHWDTIDTGYDAPQYPAGNSSNISSVSSNGTVVTVVAATAVAGTTNFANNNGWITIAGTTNYNGTYPVATWTDAQHFTLLSSLNAAAENTGTVRTAAAADVGTYLTAMYTPSKARVGVAAGTGGLAQTSIVTNYYIESASEPAPCFQGNTLIIGGNFQYTPDDPLCKEATMLNVGKLSAPAWSFSNWGRDEDLLLSYEAGSAATGARSDYVTYLARGFDTNYSRFAAGYLSGGDGRFLNVPITSIAGDGSQLTVVTSAAIDNVNSFFNVSGTAHYNGLYHLKALTDTQHFTLEVVAPYYGNVAADGTDTAGFIVSASYFCGAEYGESYCIYAPTGAPPSHANLPYLQLNRNTGNVNLAAASGKKFQVLGSAVDFNSAKNTWDTAGNNVNAGSSQAANFVATAATGTQPYAASSTTLNTNLNADLLDGLHASSLQAKSTPHLCVIENDAQSATPLTDAQITGRCDIPAAATLLEVAVYAGAGTPSVLLERWRPSGGAAADLLSGALPTGASGGYACARATTSATCLSGITSSASVTLSNTSLAAGDVVRVKSATAGGVATWHHIAVWYTEN